MSMIQIVRDGAGRIVSITFRRRSNFHAHGRWGQLMETVLPDILRHTKYVLLMPNTGPDKGGIIRTPESAALAYRRAMELRDRHGMTTCTDILTTVYLTGDVTPKMIETISRSHCVWALKSYPTDPKGTTNAGHGIPFDEIDEDVIRAMIEHRVPLLIHAEDTHDRHGRSLSHAEREAHCVEHRLRPFRERHPDLLICEEHISTAKSVALIKEDASGKTVCTVTPHHMLLTIRNLNVHTKCMPFLKSEEDRAAVAAFAISGDYRAIAGDDTAPHPAADKRVAFENAKCGCWLPHGIGIYTRVFADAGALDGRFEQFMSLNGPRWWGLPIPDARDTITIRAVKEGDVPEPLPIIGSDDVIVPMGWPDGDYAARIPVGFVAHEC